MDKMKQNRTIFAIALFAGLLPMVLTGCRKDGFDTADKVSIPLALSVGRASEGLSTKMGDKIVQADGSEASFRGIQEMYIVPFSLSSTDVSSRSGQYVVKAGDLRFSANLTLPNAISGEFKDKADQTFFGLVHNNNAHLFPNVTVEPETNAVLVYGQATEEASGTLVAGTVPYKKRYGVINPTGALTTTSGTTAGDIQFALEPFLSTDESKQNFEDWKRINIELLTGFAAVNVGGTVIFRNPATYGNDPDLTAAWEAFSCDGRVFSCSDETVGRLLTQLYRTCFSLKGDVTDVQKLANKLIDAFTVYSERLTVSGEGTSAVVTMKAGAPASYGLPDGVATMRWDKSSSKFVSLDKGDGINIANADKYCYPPALWYYANSPVRSYTRDPKITNPTLTYLESKSWAEIVQNYTIAGVNKKSDAAVIPEQLQYAVAMLKLKLVPKSGIGSTIKDGAGHSVDINNTNYPLTGIIIGGQRSQKFDFSPNDDPNMRFIYDSDVTGAWLSSSASNQPVNTLVFESHPSYDEKINFALEFRNDSTSPLYGVRECIVLPGSKFYLMGTIVLSEAKNMATNPQSSIFVRDHITTVTATFDSAALSYCYDMLPDLSIGELQVGVNVQVNWDYSTTTVQIK